MDVMQGKGPSVLIADSASRNAALRLLSRMRAAARSLALMALPALGLLVATFPLPASARQSPASSEQQKEEAGPAVHFTADELRVDTERHVIDAYGHVTLRRGDYVLRADHLRYDERTGQVTADGRVVIIDPDGNRLEVARSVLNADLKAGVVEAARLIFRDGARVAARKVIRDSNGDSRFAQAVYSPCPVCDARPQKKPLWQLKAVRVDHDRRRHRIVFRSATLEIKGVPVAWVPYVSVPDPTVRRARGLLAPDVFSRDELGVVFRLPYYLPLGERADLTVTPLVATHEAPTLALRYRQRFARAALSLEGAVTRSQRPGSDPFTTRPAAGRGYVFARLRVLHGRRWRSDLRVQAASDDTFARLYGFADVDSLTSFYRLAGKGRSWRMQAELLGFQGLHVEDRTGLTPLALPLITFSWRDPETVVGGRLAATVSSLALLRPDGADSFRQSADLSWMRAAVDALGGLWRFDLLARGDLYEVDDGERTDDPLFAGRDGTASRGIALAAVTWRWPWQAFAGGLYQRLEPVVQFVASPARGPEPAIPDEDSRSFALRFDNLFALERAPGRDLFESGPRVVYGLSYELAAGPVTMRAGAGQSYRLARLAGQFLPGTGIARRRSDVVANVSLLLPNDTSLVYDAQFDGHTLKPRRHEIFLDNRLGPLLLRGGYVKIARDLVIPDRGNREELRFSAALQLTRRFALTGGLIDDLLRNRPVEYEAGLRYETGCLELGFTVRKRNTFDRDIKPGTSFIFRFRLRNLGF